MEGRRLNRFALLTSQLFLVTVVGCSGGAKPIPLPEINAAEAAGQAIALYDTNGDGSIAGDELSAAPPLKAGLGQIDANKDDKVTKDEIEDRIRAWRESKIGMLTTAFKVTRGGKPVPRVLVTLIPESYLGTDLKRASGLTDMRGRALPTIAKEDRPFPDAPPGCQLGLYRIEVTDPTGNTTVPAKYNTATILGQELSTQDPGVQQGWIELKID